MATRTQLPAMVMVWAAITADGRSPLVLTDRGIRINAEYFRENIVEGVLKPWARKHLDRRLWTFQPLVLIDRGIKINAEYYRENILEGLGHANILAIFAPLHSARANQEWLQTEVPRFISNAQWPSKYLKSNPLDYCICSNLKSKVATKK